MAEQETPLIPTPSQQSPLSFLILLIIVALLGLAFFFGLKFRNTTSSITPTPTPEITIEPTREITPETIPSPTSTPNEKITSPTEEENLLKEAIYKKTGLSEGEASVTISKNTGKFATGGIKEYEAVGGAYWLAVKTDEGWLGVYDGQSQPECEQINLYNFPKDMVPECLDENGEVIKR